MEFSGDKPYLILALAFFGLLGLLMLYGAWHYSGDTRNFLKNASPATGTVMELRGATTKDSKGRTTKSYYPSIEFVTREGSRVGYKSSQSIDPNEYPVGEEIAVLYNRLNPADARLDHFSDLWATPVVLATMGIAFTGIAPLIYFVFHRKLQLGTLLVPGAFAVAVALMYALAWWFGSDSLHLVRHGVSSTGRIVNVNPNIVEFTTSTGKTVKYNTNVSSSPPDYAEGDEVPILYDPQTPKRAKIHSFSDLWLFSAVWGGFGTLFLLVFLYCLYVRTKG